MKYGINSLRFRRAMLWNALNDDAKKIEFAASKKKIKTWDGTSCLCTICKWTLNFFDFDMYFFRFIVNNWCKLALFL